MRFDGQYLTFDEYKSLGGSLEDENSFNLLEYEVRKKINLRTQNRLTKLDVQPIDVKLCVYNLIEKIDEEQKTNLKNKPSNIASESVGNYSVTYATGAQISEIVNSKNKEIDDYILESLSDVVVDGIKVTYLGVI